MQDTISIINEFQEDENKIPLELGPYFDSLTKPLNKEKSNLSFSLYSAGVIVIKSEVLTTTSRNKVQKILARKRLEGGIMYGLLKEINLKDYSSKLQLFNKKLEKFYFDKDFWEKIRDLLQQKVEVRFEGKGYNKKMIDIKILSSFQEKQKMTVKDLLNSGVVGALKHRTDIKDSVEYSKKLADDLLK